MALQNTIQQLQALEAADDAKLARDDQTRMVQAWCEDIGRVYEQIRAALASYENKSLAKISFDRVEATEELLGTQSYTRMNVIIVGRRIVVAPVGRFVVGGAGRIDMYRDNRPSEEHRFLIIRGLAVPDVDPSTWWIEMKGEALTRPPGPLNGYSRGSRRFRVLEASSIESAFDHLLQLP